MSNIFIGEHYPGVTKTSTGYSLDEIHFAGDVNIRLHGNIHVRGNLDVGGYLNVGGNIDVRGQMKAQSVRCRVLYWGLMCLPNVPRQKIHVSKIRPIACCREYWSERLGVNLTGCYAEIEAQIKPMLPTLLHRDDWTVTERWILESYLGERDEDR